MARIVDAMGDSMACITMRSRLNHFFRKAQFNGLLGSSLDSQSYVIGQTEKIVQTEEAANSRLLRSRQEVEGLWQNLEC